MNLTLHIPGTCPCIACVVATTPQGAANISEWNGYAGNFPDPFLPTAAETAAALDEEGDSLFDLLSFNPFADEVTPLLTDGEWPCCPFHGFHEAEEDGEPLCYCKRCERRW